MDPYDAYINDNKQTNSQVSSPTVSDPYDDYVAQAQSTPKDLAIATSDKVPTNPNTGSADYNGWCQAFVEQVTGDKRKFPSALNAWNDYVQKGQAQGGTEGIEPGDIVYLSPNSSNGGYGHTGIYAGDDKFVSATDNGIQTNNLQDWQNMTGQQILGYVKNPNLPEIGGSYGSN